MQSSPYKKKTGPVDQKRRAIYDMPVPGTSIYVYTVVPVGNSSYCNSSDAVCSYPAAVPASHGLAHPTATLSVLAQSANNLLASVKNITTRYRKNARRE